MDDQSSTKNVANLKDNFKNFKSILIEAHNKAEDRSKNTKNNHDHNYQMDNEKSKKIDEDILIVNREEVKFSIDQINSSNNEPEDLELNSNLKVEKEQKGKTDLKNISFNELDFKNLEHNKYDQRNSSNELINEEKIFSSVNNISYDKNIPPKTINDEGSMNILDLVKSEKNQNYSFDDDKKINDDHDEDIDDDISSSGNNISENSIELSKTKIPWKIKIKDFFNTVLNSEIFLTISNACIIIALFIDPLEHICFPISWDIGVDYVWMTILCFFFVEIMLKILFEDFYNFSFYFWADWVFFLTDVISVFGLFFGSENLGSIFIVDSNLSKTMRLTQSASRISRMLSLTGLMKTLSIFKVGRLYKSNLQEFLKKSQKSILEFQLKEQIRVSRRNTLALHKLKDKVSFFRKLDNLVNFKDTKNYTSSDSEEENKDKRKSVVNKSILKNFFEYTINNEYKNSKQRKMENGSNIKNNFKKLKTNLNLETFGSIRNENNKFPQKIIHLDKLVNEKKINERRHSMKIKSNSEEIFENKIEQFESKMSGNKIKVKFNDFDNKFYHDERTSPYDGLEKAIISFKKNPSSSSQNLNKYQSYHLSKEKSTKINNMNDLTYTTKTVLFEVKEDENEFDFNKKIEKIENIKVKYDSEDYLSDSKEIKFDETHTEDEISNDKILYTQENIPNTSAITSKSEMFFCECNNLNLVSSNTSTDNIEQLIQPLGNLDTIKIPTKAISLPQRRFSLISKDVLSRVKEGIFLSKGDVSPVKSNIKKISHILEDTEKKCIKCGGLVVNNKLIGESNIKDNDSNFSSNYGSDEDESVNERITENLNQIDKCNNYSQLKTTNCTKNQQINLFNNENGKNVNSNFKENLNHNTNLEIQSSLLNKKNFNFKDNILNQEKQYSQPSYCEFLTLVENKKQPDNIIKLQTCLPKNDKTKNKNFLRSQTAKFSNEILKEVKDEIQENLYIDTASPLQNHQSSQNTKLKTEKSKKKKKEKKNNEFFKLKIIEESEENNNIGTYSRLAVLISKITSIRLICLILLILFVLPYLTESTYIDLDSEASQYLFFINMLEILLKSNPSYFIENIETKIKNTTFMEENNMNLISFGFNNNKTICELGDLICLNYHQNSTIYFDYKIYNITRDRDRIILNRTNLYLIYSIRGENYLDNILMILKVIFIGSILFSGSFYFLSDSNRIVVILLEETYKEINEMKISHENFFNDEIIDEKENKFHLHLKTHIWKSASSVENNSNEKSLIETVTNSNTFSKKNNNDKIILEKFDTKINVEEYFGKEKINLLVKKNELNMLQSSYVKLQKLLVSLYGLRVFDYLQSNYIKNLIFQNDLEKENNDELDSPENMYINKIENNQQNPFFTLNGVIIIVEVSNLEELLKKYKENITGIFSRIVQICDITSFETGGQILKYENNKILIFWDQGETPFVNNESDFKEKPDLNIRNNLQNRKYSRKVSEFDIYSESVQDDQKSDEEDINSELSHEFSKNNDSIFKDFKSFSSENFESELSPVEKAKIINIKFSKMGQTFATEVLPEVKYRSSLHKNSCNLAVTTAIKIHSRILNDFILNPKLHVQKDVVFKENNLEIKIAIHKGQFFNFILNSTNRLESVYAGSILENSKLMSKLNVYKLPIILSDEVYNELDNYLKNIIRDVSIIFKNSKLRTNTSEKSSTMKINSQEKNSLETKKVFCFDLDYKKEIIKNPYLTKFRFNYQHALIIKRSLINQINYNRFNFKKFFFNDLEIIYSRPHNSAFLDFFKDGVFCYSNSNFKQANTYLEKALIFNKSDIITRLLLSNIENNK